MRPHLSLITIVRVKRPVNCLHRRAHLTVVPLLEPRLAPAFITVILDGGELLRAPALIQRRPNCLLHLKCHGLGIRRHAVTAFVGWHATR